MFSLTMSTRTKKTIVQISIILLAMILLPPPLSVWRELRRPEPEACTLVAMLLFLLCESWAVRRGFRAWSVLAFGDGEVTTPSWRKLGWWFC